MAKRKGAELHIIVNQEEGISCVQIVGPIETHSEGHDLYFRIMDLVQDFDKAIQKRIEEYKSSAEANEH
ncbi:MAG: hypothetical protein ACM3SR_18275 [Ignavibacteriales bacterium]